MKIFLTEYEHEGHLYSGVNIFAETEDKAEDIAKRNGLIIIGEILDISFRPEIKKHMEAMIELEMPDILH